MKKIKVIVKDRTILELEEDAKTGDIIDLEELVSVDTDFIEEVIANGKDKVYEQKLSDYKKYLDINNKVELDALNNQIEALKKEKENSLLLKEQEEKNKYSKTISDLEKEVEILKSANQSSIALEKQNYLLEKEKKDREYSEKYQDLENKYNQLKESLSMQLTNKEMEVKASANKEILDLKLQLETLKNDSHSQMEILKVTTEKEFSEKTNTLKETYEKALKDKEELINNLKRQKASLNVKQTGEDLESWCHNEVTSYMQNGLFNCTWEKDNVVVKNEDEKNGSKADYIFRVYASKEHLVNEELSSICMDMKDENPDSVNKQTNEHYYKKLDDNRKKKNCKYALLVSNLEMDKPNLLPIFKVIGYEDMYVVRPAYLMVFLNMIASLTVRFSDLVLSDKKDTLELKEKLVLEEEFKSIKETYLDKPLEQLGKQIDNIISSSGKIKDAAKAIDEACEKINNNYIKAIEEKLSKFTIRLEKNVLKKI